MSNRLKAFENKSSNPAQYFLNWNQEGYFEYYDKEAKEKKKFSDLPFTFLTLEVMSTVKGWSDSAQSGIFSNEVKFIGKEEITVKLFKGGEIAKGIYKEQKQKIVDAGGQYHLSIYAMTMDGELINISLKGASVSEWSNFTQKTRNRLGGEWVTIDSIGEGKKGVVKYTYPEFRFDGSLEKKFSDMADEKYDELEVYLNAYKKQEPAAAPLEEYPDDNTPDEVEVPY
jgi:hypothetical protein